MGLFLITVLGIWAVMHAYVFWRLSSLPWVAAHLPTAVLVLAAVVLWSSYVLARVLDSRGWQSLSWPLEYLAANWIGVLFLLFCALLAADVITLGGRLFPARLPAIRTAAVIVALVLSLASFVQALRMPVVKEHEVQLEGLPAAQDGTVLLALSDLHLGNLLGRRWLTNLAERIQRVNPDAILLVGDVVDGNVGRVEPLREILAGLKAPLGVWAVLGNHEYYAGVDRCVALFERAGFHLLRDRHQQLAPGLTLAGVDDLTARQQFGLRDHPLEHALRERAPGATILLSHSPWQAEAAAAAGVGLMLSGHTHNGQIWPFTYLVSWRYPRVAGRYEVGGMSLIVCRGTGTWGPRMRLWRPSEILKITLRTKSVPSAVR